MQVLTLNPNDFGGHAQSLAKAVEDNSDTSFDAIVAVRRGGSFVCDAFCRHFPKDRYGERFDVTLQRPSSKRKEGTVGKILRSLPLSLLNAMRKAEAVLLTLLRNVKKGSPLPDVKIPDGLEAILTMKKRPKILVIDDAIDSGDTILAIADRIRKTKPDTMICVAVMTETTSKPRIRANYTLYRNKTLIRFPWSNDYKEN